MHILEELAIGSKLNFFFKGQNVKLNIDGINILFYNIL